MEIVYRFNIKEGRSGEYVDFVSKNEEVMRDNAPAGWTYRGTFVTVQALGDFDVEQRWQIDDYANLGAGWGHDEVWDRTLAEAQDFVEGRVSATVVKSVDEVAVLEGT